MGSVQDFGECPQCHSYDIEKVRCLIIELDTRSQTLVAGCTVCGYGFTEMIVPKCAKCEVDFNTLVSSLDDAFWMLESGYSVKACPACGCTQMIYEFERYYGSQQWYGIPIDELKPIPDELLIESKTLGSLLEGQPLPELKDEDSEEEDINSYD